MSRCPAATPPTPAALAPEDPLEQLNHAFRDAYAARRDAVLEQLGPAIAQIDDALIFRLRGQRLVGPARTRRYHELKTMCHVPLAILSAVGDEAGELDEAARGSLKELARHLEAVLAGLGARGLDEAQRARQARLLTGSQAFIAALLASGHVERAALREFLGAQTPDIQANLEDAARDQIETMHATFGAWARELSAEEWRALKVVVGSSHMARTGNVASQYFTVALGESWEGRFQQEDLKPDRRVLTSESASDEQSAFELLAMHVFDISASRDFFAEDGRLGRDVLANATERLLTAMFGERPQRPAGGDTDGDGEPA